MGLRTGLLYVWASACGAMFLLYVVFSFVTPVIGFIDYTIYNLMAELGVPQSWINVYNQWVPYLRDFFGYTAIALFISLVIYLLVNSARREPTEYVY